MLLRRLCDAFVSPGLMTELREHVESCSSATKKLYIHYHNALGHQILQGGDLPSGDPTHSVI